MPKDPDAVSPTTMATSNGVPHKETMTITPDELTNVLEAYEVFCDIGWHHVAWRNLYLFLDHYLSQYFQYRNQVRKRSRSLRAQYLAGLPITQFGDITSDTVYVFLCNNGSQPTNAHDTPSRSLLSSLSISDLHLLLDDVTEELNGRSSQITSRSKATSIASLPKAWSPSHGTDWRTAHTLAILVGREDDLWSQERALDDEKIPRFLFDTPRRLLRRALSARISPQNRLKKPTLKRTQSLRETATILPRRNGDISEIIASLPEKIDPTRMLSAPSVFEDDDSETEIDMIKLDSILEEDEVDGNGALDIPNTSDLSLYSSQTLDSLIDLYGNPCIPGSVSHKSRKSATSTSIGSSISIGELEKNELHKLVGLPKGLLGDHSSLLSVTRISTRTSVSDITSKTFITAKSNLSIADHAKSRGSSINTFLSATTPASSENDCVRYGPYHSLLQSRELIPSSALETDWSGRGQHVEYAVNEQDQIPLDVERLLGETRNALVESVRCKRVRLVRKVIHCTKWNGLKIEDALTEVQNLYRVQHSHVVRLVGTYVVGQNLAILTYPCSEWNLEQFLNNTITADDAKARCASLRQFFTCLAKALDFMHSFPLKHMDIKPQNLLVRDIRNSIVNNSDPYKIYITDFGISRSYNSLEASETETPTAFTRTYAAQEVILQEPRGLSADIFSLGCVYTEMLAIVLDDPSVPRACATNWDSLAAARRKTEGDLRPYHLSATDVRSWLLQLAIDEPEMDVLREWTYNMLDSAPSQRPSASHIAHDPHLPFACTSCTLRTGPEAFEVA